jgi:hypothetical protein
MEGFINIIDYEKFYKINNEGQVWSERQKKMLKGRIHTQGYLRVSLCKENTIKDFYIHRLVAQHFLPNPNNFIIIDHIDNNKKNNLVDNLRWTTSSENNRNIKIKKLASTNERNISITRDNTFQVRFKANHKYIFNNFFKTIEEAIIARDNFKKENNLIS